MRFATNDVLTWPITAQSSPDGSSGFGLWFKLDSTAANQALFRVRTGTGAASANKISATFLTSGTEVQAAFYTPFFATRESGAIDTAWHFLTIEFDGAALTGPERMTLTLDGALVGTGGAGTGALVSGVTGNILLGNAADGVASSPLNGLLGPNIYSFATKMPGAEFGLLTSAARAALMAFEAPT
jgi:hypothetical protein